MKTLFLSIVIAAVAPALPAQGVFIGSNGGARTRIGSVDGPLADTNIFGQFLAGKIPLQQIDRKAVRSY